MEIDEKAIEEILDALFKMEKLLGKAERAKLLDALDLIEKIDTKEFREAVETLQHTELDTRMTRLRIQAVTGLMPPSLRSDPDRTPVEPLQARRRSSQTLPAVTIPKPKRTPSD